MKGGGGAARGAGKSFEQSAKIVENFSEKAKKCDYCKKKLLCKKTCQHTIVDTTRKSMILRTI